MLTARFRIPTLLPGCSHEGPDYYRSSGSGHRPVIHHALEGNRRFIVCREADLQEAISINKSNQRPTRCVKSQEGCSIYFFSQQKQAELKFREMCQVQIEQNRAAHQQHMKIAKCPVQLGWIF